MLKMCGGCLYVLHPFSKSMRDFSILLTYIIRINHIICLKKKDAQTRKPPAPLHINYKLWINATTGQPKPVKETILNIYIDIRSGEAQASHSHQKFCEYFTCTFKIHIFGATERGSVQNHTADDHDTSTTAPLPPLLQRHKADWSSASALSYLSVRLCSRRRAQLAGWVSADQEAVCASHQLRGHSTFPGPARPCHLWPDGAGRAVCRLSVSPVCRGGIEPSWDSRCSWGSCS